jgi:hypothetical protein
MSKEKVYQKTDKILQSRKEREKEKGEREGEKGRRREKRKETHLHNNTFGNNTIYLF